jgi:uncharacterized cupredoxin-like copper-binding protein
VRRFRLFVAMAIVALLLVPALPANARIEQGTATVTVTATEFKFKLSKTKLAPGTHTFRLKNAGRVPHDFKIKGKKTPIIAGGKSAALTVRFTKPGKYRYICTVPGHAAAGMKGTFTIT